MGPQKSLHLDPHDMPSKAGLREQIDSLLSPIFPLLSPNPPFDRRTVLTDEPVRQVEGLGQILFQEERSVLAVGPAWILVWLADCLNDGIVNSYSRDLYAQLITPPILKPLDWKRSRVRREQLISLGIPVNLDEVRSLTWMND